MSRRIIPVSTLVHYLKGNLEADPVLHGVLVEGEISNIRKPYSGHWYFTLKDEKSGISCVMFSSYNKKVLFDAQNGDKVEIRGDVSVYETGGSLQIIVNAMRRAGIGDLYQKFEELKKKLSAEGLFDENIKKSLPAYPFDIALVSGNQTAAREDVLITLKKRWPVAKITEYPAPVQGNDAAPKIMEVLKKADKGHPDVILLVRGGGSIEDLWCFNDESLARFLRNMQTPVVTGIGHEIDFTLCDFTSDLRANTPTGAAEAAVPDIKEVLSSIEHRRELLVRSMRDRLQNTSIQLDHLSSSSVLSDPQRLIINSKKELTVLETRLNRFPESLKQKEMEIRVVQHRFLYAFDQIDRNLKDEISAYGKGLEEWWDKTNKENNDSLSELFKALQTEVIQRLQKEDEKLRMNTALLDAYSPLKVLKRGYSVVSRNNKVIADSTLLNRDDQVHIRFGNGSVDAIVQEVHNASKNS